MLCLDVIETHSDGFGALFREIANFVMQVVHQMTLLDGIYFVKGARDMKAYGRMVGGEVERLVLQFLMGKPPSVAAAKL